jgi:hypothetical protein
VVDSRDLTVLVLMDVLDLNDSLASFESLGRRIAYARAYRDVSIGRVFERDLIGRIWFNYDASVGLEPDPGMDHPRTGLALGAERTAA